jgi:hypothetical protein
MMHYKESIAVMIERLVVSLILCDIPYLWAVNLLTLGAVTSIKPYAICKRSLDYVT